MTKLTFTKAGLFLSIVTIMPLLYGCGESDDQKAFRAELVEKALNDAVSRKGEAFMADYTKAADVVALPSGVLYKEKVRGQGAFPKLTDWVEVRYQGRLVDGHIFDEQKGKPSQFPLNGVIKGWQQALSHMPVGSRWEIVVPAQLAYGAKSPSPDIPANSVLIFDIELLGVRSR